MAEQSLSFRDLRVYQKMLNLQQDIFEASKTWPKEEKYALTDQVRRSSRSVGGGYKEIRVSDQSERIVDYGHYR
jgi:four helix bundle protein